MGTPYLEKSKPMIDGNVASLNHGDIDTSDTSLCDKEEIRVVQLMDHGYHFVRQRGLRSCLEIQGGAYGYLVMHMPTPKVVVHYAYPLVTLVACSFIFHCEISLMQ